MSQLNLFQTIPSADVAPVGRQSIWMWVLCWRYYAPTIAECEAWVDAMRTQDGVLSWRVLPAFQRRWHRPAWWKMGEVFFADEPHLLWGNHAKRQIQRIDPQTILRRFYVRDLDLEAFIQREQKRREG